ncbi:di-trans-poly-cis-decaprenylcistransferase [Halorubrum sp. CBA1125]|uniref:undecaprenyl diphosphate synthase family protein n=1 Tax=Halorubrum sp. CBA1125 TaxID=2668072 RepID=UPI00135E9BA2|nr:undecaprenyl diphosphate synthase family protein [Halorubrum sp. CBA1125]MUW15893.1 di-trans-poly-cis-decaprenylcistransferase [Halorubrum sp. CBA1125]
MGLYDTYLAVRHRFHDGDPPEHVALVLTERDLLADGAFDTLAAALRWAFEYGATRVTVSVSVLDAAVVPTLLRELRRLDPPEPFVAHGPDATDADYEVDAAEVDRPAVTDDDQPDVTNDDQPDVTDDDGEIDSRTRAESTAADGDLDDVPIRITVGLGGKAEFAAAVREIAADVDAGELDPAAIDEADVTDRLVFPEEPDLVIKTGAERLSDFGIWQSVYAELYFTDVNWRDFRRRDYLRAVLDFQDRQRRFGR